MALAVCGARVVHRSEGAGHRRSDQGSRLWTQARRRRASQWRLLTLVGSAGGIATVALLPPHWSVVASLE